MLDEKQFFETEKALGRDEYNYCVTKNKNGICRRETEMKEE